MYSPSLSSLPPSLPPSLTLSSYRWAVHALLTLGVSLLYVLSFPWCWVWVC